MMHTMTESEKVDALAFEQRLLELRKNRRTGVITTGVLRRKGFSGRDLAAGAEVEARRDEYESNQP